MTPVEIMALIMVLGGVVKTIFFFQNPKSLTGIINSLSKNSFTIFAVYFEFSSSSSGSEKLNWLVFPAFHSGSVLLVTLVSFALAVVVLRYLLQEVNMVEIFAVMLFLSLLIMMAVGPFFAHLAPFYQKMLQDKKLLQKTWPLIVVWFFLSAWVLYHIFR